MHILSEQDSIAHHYIAELRHQEVQQDPMRFRFNLSRLGEMMGYEISKTLSYQDQEVSSVLGNAPSRQLDRQPILLTVMRAGLPFFDGFQRVFDRAWSGFVGAYRSRMTGQEGFTIELGYQAAPDLAGQEVILSDPMLASGQSLLKAIHTLSSHGAPAHWHIATAIAAPEGVEYLKQSLNIPYTLWVGALDSHLNDKSYIVPGLGDAGDLAFGHKK